MQLVRQHAEGHPGILTKHYSCSIKRYALYVQVAELTDERDKLDADLSALKDQLVILQRLCMLLFRTCASRTWRVLYDDVVCMQEDLTINLDRKDVALSKAQEEAAAAVADAQRTQKEAADAIASASANAEQECKRAKVAANREIDEYKERINQVYGSMVMT